METLAFLAPAFLVFEVWQLFMGERYLGIKQIARGADPRTLGLHEVTAFLWVGGLTAYWVWMALLLLAPPFRLYGLGLLAVTALGFATRRGAPLKWILVTMTFEGALRFGLLVALTASFWWRRR